MKYIIVCINNNVEILDSLYNKISRIVDSDYIIESYINAQQALVGCLNNIISGNEVLITISGSNTSKLKCEEFILGLHKNSPNTKNIIFNRIAAPIAWFDKKFVDGTMEGIGNKTVVISKKIKGIQSGKVQDYAFGFIAGVVVLALVFIYLWTN